MKRERKAADFEWCNMVSANWKPFNGKAIKNPSGKAGEYSYWGCYFHVGCSCGCTYCFNKTGRFKAVLGGDVPMLKKCFKNEEHALEVFGKEMFANKDLLKEHGLFFTFTSDPFLPETVELNTKAILTAIINEIPVKVLTKRADFLGKDSIFINLLREHGIIMRDMKYIAFGFTLTGHNEMEPNASTNDERIEAMRKLHDAGFKTWASIEPIIDFESSKRIIDECFSFCDLFKIGLKSGQKYSKKDVREFVEWNVCSPVFYEEKIKFYFKDSLLKQAGINREDLPSNCVCRDYNIFNL